MARAKRPTPLRLPLAGALLLLAACAPAEDTEGDMGGPDDAANNGSETSHDDPESESESETGEPDPTQPMGERPPLGFACDTTPVPTGLSVEDVVPDVVGVDQWGEELSLYADLCERTVLLVRAGTDCGECNQEAPEFGELHQLYADQGFIVLTMLHYGDGPIGLEQQKLWASTHGLLHPVVEDNDFALSDTYWPGFLGRPRTKLLGPGAVVLRDNPSVEEIAALFE